ncbi:MAG: 3-hydroxyacyl-CoA dehydrogenase family protein [Planctomycetaceae bacterium]|nr:3-hydroxyacyl-CoA dehydrogenase family protein [Planctomycetaceae bacterium]
MNIDSIRSVAVLGLGTMGHGIAQTFALAGYQVQGYDEHPAARANLHERIRKNLDAFVASGLLPSSAVEPALQRIKACDTEQAAVNGVQFVTEAVAEDLNVKQALFARLEPLVGDDTILASNSSSFPISQSGVNLKWPERAVVTHWFNPPHLVPLVEVVPGPQTAEGTTLATMALMQHIGKHPLRLRKELPGFLVNRIQVAIMREVWDLLEQGVASADEIDAALRTSVGFRLAAVGPLEVHDFGGLDIQTTVFRNLAPEIRSNVEVPKLVADLVAQGHLGAKTGRGFQEYPPAKIAERQQRRDRLFLALIKLLYADSIKGDVG